MPTGMFISALKEENRLLRKALGDLLDYAENQDLDPELTSVVANARKIFHASNAKVDAVRRKA